MISGLIKTVIMLSLLVALTMSLCIISVSAEDMNDYQKIIKRKCGYPQDEIYVLPIKLPVRKADAKVNGEYLKVAHALESTNDVKIESTQLGTLLTPIGNNHDVLLRTLDLSYKLESLGVILGVYNFQALTMKENNGEIIVSGNKTFTPSRLYKDVIKVLASVDAAKYVKHEVQWKIVKNGTKYRVTETLIK